ncbi:GTP-binding protein, partial [Vibrio parahaemolyticus]|nr:GTP-binding protein [Vibrio parahaemolyticus]
MSEVNLIVIGKTGVGKSSFCNYIFGEELFERGDGAPV